MKKKCWTLAILWLMLWMVSCSSSSGKQSQSSSPSPSPESSATGEKSGGEQKSVEDHPYIKGAKPISIEPIESNELDVSGVDFVGETKIVVSYLKDLGEKKNLMYDLETQSFVKLPDNLQILKRLESGEWFASSDADHSYLVLDPENYSIRKTLKPPAGTDQQLDISPDGRAVAFVTREGLFVSDLDFKAPVLLVPIKQEQDDFKTERPRSPLWLDNSRVLYKMLVWEGVRHNAIIDREGKNPKILEESKDGTLYPLISGDFLYRGEYGKGCGWLDGASGAKKMISKSLLEKEGFTYDKNGKWVAFFQTNPEVSEQNKWTVRFEVRAILSGEPILKFESEEQKAIPIEDSVASPDGKKILFTDLDKSGRRVLYQLEIKTETSSSS